MQASAALFLLFLGCTYASLTQIGNNASDVGLLWNGFNFVWKRRAVVSQTPHRISAWTVFPSVPESDGVQVSSSVTYGWGVGVDGDYAYPDAVYQAASSSEGDMKFWYYKQHLMFTDLAKPVSTRCHLHPKIACPVAVTHKQSKLTFRLDGWDGGMSGWAGTAVLGGWDLRMHCNNAVQPHGHKCNSNGMWANVWRIGVHDCELSGGSLTCNSNILINRTANPDFMFDAGSKPFNFALTYNLTVYYTVMVANTSSTRFIVQKPIESHHDLWSSNHKHAAHLKYDTGLPKRAGGVTQFGLGINSFGWTLGPDGCRNILLRAKCSKHHKVPLGRYLTSIQAKMDQFLCDPAIRYCQLNYTMGMTAPKTTWDIDAHTRMGVTMIQSAADGVRIEPMQLRANPNGTICIGGSDHMWSCRLVNLPQQPYDTVKFHEKL